MDNEEKVVKPVDSEEKTSTIKPEVPEEKEIVEKGEPAITLPEEKENIKIEGKEMEKADFSSVFNVASEEKEEPKEEPKKEEPAITLPEEKEDIKIEGKEMEKADFSSVFNVASEEKEEPKEEETPVETTPEPSKEERETKPVVRYNSEEKTLYTIKEEKESNPIGVILFFVILAIVIFFLPQLTKTSEAALEKLYGNNPGAVVQPAGDGKETENKYYYFDGTLEYELDDLLLTNAVKSSVGNEYKLTITVFNKASKPFTFDKNYYIFLYNENQLLSRTKFFSYDAIAPNGANEVSFIINKGAKESANRFAFVLVDKNDYPDVQLTDSEDDYKVLTCTYLNDEIKYYFKDDKLAKIREKYKEQKTKTNYYYEEHKKTYKELSEKYNSIESFESIFVERDLQSEDVQGEYEMINNLDLVNINDKTLSNLRTYKFFSYNESKDVVSYEITSFGYSCGS